MTPFSLLMNLIFLGLYINSKLNWDTHTNVIGKRISCAVGIIKKMQLVFPKSVLITIYNALILPHINYCLLSWGLDTELLFKLYNVLKVEDVLLQLF